MSQKINFRQGTVKDCSLIYGKVKDIHSDDMVKITKDEFTKELCGENKFVEVLIAETDEEVPKFVGYAIYFPFFHSFSGKRLFLDDLYIEHRFRDKKYGKEFFCELAKIGTRKECNTIEWPLLPDNDAAVGFYKSLGAIDSTVIEKWHTFFIPEDKFKELASS